MSLVRRLGNAATCAVAGAMLLSASLSAQDAGCPPEVCILAPKDGEDVSERPIVEVRVEDPRGEVWLIVHPMEVSDFWVQPRLQRRGEGEWRGSIYIGRPGAIDVGKHFEIMAVVDPEDLLSEGDILSDFPQARHRSDIVEVVRR